MSYTSTGGLPTIPRLAVAGVDEGAPDTTLTTGSAGSLTSLNLPTQAVAPAVPASGVVLYANSSGRLSWRSASDTFSRSIIVTATGNRTFTAPDADFTFAGQNLANTFTLANTFSANGALSAPAVSFTGTPITGGSASTTVGLLKIGSGTSGGLSTSGTMLEIQAPNAFVGDLINAGVNGTSVFRVLSTGALVANSTIVSAGSVRGTADSSTFTLGASNDVIQSRKAAANLQLGAADAASPVAQTLSVQSVVAGTSNTAGANFTIKGSTGTGTGTGGSILFQTAPAGSTGTAQNAFSTAMTIAGSGAITFPVSGALSAPAVSFTGTPITGGTATTTKPMVLIETSGATSTGWVTGGTMFGVNAPSGFSAYLCDLQTNGASSFVVTASGNVRATGQYQTGATTGATDTFLSRKAAANWQLGSSDAAFAIAQTLSVQSVVAGTTDTAGANFTIKGSAGTGTGAGGSIIFQVAPAGSTGSSQNAFSTAWSISSAGHFLAGTDNTYDIGASAATRPRLIYTAGGAVLNNVAIGSGASSSLIRITASSDGVLKITNDATTDFNRIQFGGTTSSFPALKRSSTALQARLADDSAYAPVEASTVRTATAYTVATLPAAGTAGRRAYVTDATAPTYLGALVGGGAVVCPVFDNGSAWVSA